jgi:hypothetical protein
MMRMEMKIDMVMRILMGKKRIVVFVVTVPQNLRTFPKNVARRTHVSALILKGKFVIHVVILVLWCHN